MSDFVDTLPFRPLMKDWLRKRGVGCYEDLMAPNFFGDESDDEHVPTRTFGIGPREDAKLRGFIAGLVAMADYALYPIDL